MAVAVFNYALWAARYPALAAKVDEPTATAFFMEAGALYLDNSDCSPFPDVGARLILLNMLVAHIATLTTSQAAQQGLVGRVSSVTEGSVSISVELAPGSDIEAWYSQTQPGLAFWVATASLRSAFYVPGDQPFLDVPGYGGWGGGNRFGGFYGSN